MEAEAQILGICLEEDMKLPPRLNIPALLHEVVQG